MIVILALSTCQVLAGYSFEVQSSEIRYRFKELSQANDYESLILAPVRKALFADHDEEMLKTLYDRTFAEVTRLVDGILKKEGGDRVAEYERRFLDPCVELLTKLGRPIEDFLEDSKSKPKHRILAQLPITIYKVCDYLIDAGVASDFIH